MALLRGVSAAFDSPGLTWEFRKQAMLNWIFFDDHVCRKSMHKIDTSGSDWANEPETVAGFPSSQLKALRCNCEMLLQYTDVRRAMRSGTMGPVLVCERCINSYSCEERFSRVAGIHGYKPSAAAIASTCAAIGRLSAISVGPRDFCMYVSKKS